MSARVLARQIRILRSLQFAEPRLKHLENIMITEMPPVDSEPEASRRFTLEDHVRSRILLQRFGQEAT